MPPMEAVTPGSITSLAVTYALVADEKSTSDKESLEMLGTPQRLPDVNMARSRRGIIPPLVGRAHASHNRTAGFDSWPWWRRHSLATDCARAGC